MTLQILTGLVHEGQFPNQRGGFVNRQRYGLERSASANGRVPDAPNLLV